MSGGFMHGIQSGIHILLKILFFVAILFFSAEFLSVFIKDFDFQIVKDFTLDLQNLFK
jgi:hypothetical protein